MSDSPQPIVILGTGRSFTSVINCMIGNHPEMIGLPETNLFRDATLGALFQRFEKGANRQRRGGLLRTIAHFHDGAQTEETITKASRFLEAHLDWTYRDIADYLVKITAPRGIVEKSISTCREPETLARVRECWPNALFLHITRHPEAIVKSMHSRIAGAIENGKGRRLQRMLGDHTLDEYYIGYSTTILEFMATLPAGTSMNLRGEDYLTDARSYNRDICTWAGLRNDDEAVEAMMHPENNPFAHVGPESAKGGMSSTFLKSPFYSGEPVPVNPMSFQADDPDLTDVQRSTVLLGNRLGYA